MRALRGVVYMSEVKSVFFPVLAFFRQLVWQRFLIDGGCYTRSSYCDVLRQRSATTPRDNCAAVKALSVFINHAYGFFRN